MIRSMISNEVEINKIMKIWKEATIKAHDFIPEEFWNESYHTVLNEYIPIAETYVYIDDGDDIKGFISVINKVFIGAVFVDVNSQGKGIGSKLIAHVKEIYDYLELSVYKDNENSVYFYKKVGFEVMREEMNEETNKIEYLMNYKNK